MEQRFRWKREYEGLASQFLKQHFGGPQGVVNCFPCTRGDYPWGEHRPSVVDSRVPAKNNTEYHGLERHAMQYHATNQYEYAYHHWILAAFWRLEDMKTNGFDDARHDAALEYCLKHAHYNEALHLWQQSQRTRRVPTPEEFELNPVALEAKTDTALDQLSRANSSGKKAK